MATAIRQFGLVVVGSGPAGLAPLLAAHRLGSLDQILDDGVALVEKTEWLGSGTIGKYTINSDSSGTTFADCLRSPEQTPLTALASHPLAQCVAAAGDGTVPLRLAGQFLGLVGETLGRMIAERPGCEVLVQHTAISVQRSGAYWRVKLRTPHGGDRVLLARNVVLATGGHQPHDRLVNESVGGRNLLEHYRAKLLQSDEVLDAGGLDLVAARLSGRAEPQVAVIGGSTSAASVAYALLNRLPGISFGHSGVTLLHRRELRIFYLDAASALAEGYTEFGQDDICPISGRVFRFAGFRLDQRELVMRARGIGGRPPEPRLALHHLRDGSEREAVRILDQADLVVAAMGYRPHALAVLDKLGAPVQLLAHTGPQQPLVDGHCQVLDAAGDPLAGLFGIGLAAGFRPSGALGGEPSFRGQANGLWLWQNDVGALIVHAMLKPVTPQFETLPGQIGPGKPQSKTPEWTGPAVELAGMMVEQPGASFAGEGA